LTETDEGAHLFRNEHSIFRLYQGRPVPYIHTAPRSNTGKQIFTCTVLYSVLAKQRELILLIVDHCSVPLSGTSKYSVEVSFVDGKSHTTTCSSKLTLPHANTHPESPGTPASYFWDWASEVEPQVSFVVDLLSLQDTMDLIADVYRSKVSACNRMFSTLVCEGEPLVFHKVCALCVQYTHIVHMRVLCLLCQCQTLCTVCESLQDLKVWLISL
jgi:hypothetical protein